MEAVGTSAINHEYVLPLKTGANRYSWP